MAVMLVYQTKEVLLKIFGSMYVNSFVDLNQHGGYDLN